MISEICMACLFLMLSYGWTLSFQDIDWDSNLEIFIPVGSLTVAVHLILAAMTYIDEDAYHKYHDFSGIQGIILMVLRVALFCFYIYSYFKNYKTIPMRAT